MPQAPASTRPGRTCPNCAAFVPQGNPRCGSCKLEVNQMDAFAAAKKAARAKGIRGVSDAPRETPFFLRPGIIMLLLLVVLVGAGVAYYLRPRPPRYMTFPASAQDSVQAILTHISAGTDPECIKAYGLIADSVRNPRADDEQGSYMQVFHVMNQYLSGEFGNGWLTQAKLAPDPADPNTIVVKVSMETLRLHAAQQTPPDKIALQGSHFAITGIDEFNIADAAEMQKMAIIGDVFAGIGGPAAKNNLDTILGASAANRHQPRMLMKIDLLAINRNPHAATWKSVIQMYPLRDDPVVKNRLAAIIADDRYDAGVREKAQKLLTGRFDTDDPDLNAAGVPY